MTFNVREFIAKLAAEKPKASKQMTKKGSAKRLAAVLLTKTAVKRKVMESMQDEYGKKKGKEVYYATANKQNRSPETFKKKD